MCRERNPGLYLNRLSPGVPRETITMSRYARSQKLALAHLAEVAEGQGLIVPEFIRQLVLQRPVYLPVGIKVSPDAGAEDAKTVAQASPPPATVP